MQNVTVLCGGELVAPDEVEPRPAMQAERNRVCELALELGSLVGLERDHVAEEDHLDDALLDDAATAESHLAGGGHSVRLSCAPRARWRDPDLNRGRTIFRRGTHFDRNCGDYHRQLLPLTFLSGE
jgi:hypothetical protein